MKNEKKVPFFAKFLENQLNEGESVHGGKITKPSLDTVFTKKYPSDDDEPVTLKYPSDNDEHVTLKYPSDNDEI